MLLFALFGCEKRLFAGRQILRRQATAGCGRTRPSTPAHARRTRRLGGGRSRPTTWCQDALTRTAMKVRLRLAKPHGIQPSSYIYILLAFIDYFRYVFVTISPPPSSRKSEP